MQLCKPQMPQQCVSERDRRFGGGGEIFGIFHLNQLCPMLAPPRSSNAVRGRSNRQFLRWKHSVWETLSQMRIKRTYVHYVSLQTQRGGLSSPFFFFQQKNPQSAGSDPWQNCSKSWGRMRVLSSKTRRGPQAGEEGGELKGIAKVSRTLAKKRRRKKKNKRTNSPT